MIIPSAIAASALLILCRWLERYYARSLSPPKWRYAACKATKHYLVVFAPVALIFAAASIALRSSVPSHLTLDRLRTLQEGLERIHSTADHLKLSPAKTALVLVLSYVPALLGLKFGARLPSSLRRYRRVSGGLNSLLLAATFFTFFGREAGDLAFIAQGRISSARRGYALAQEELERRAEEDYAQEVPSLILQRVPTSDRQRIERLDRAASDAQDMMRRYDEASYRRVVNASAETEMLIALSFGHTDTAESYYARSYPEAPSESTPAAIFVLQHQLSASKPGESVGVRCVKDVLAQGVRQLWNGFAKSTALDTLAEAHPWLKPLVEVTESAVTDRAKEEVNRYVDKIAAQAAAGRLREAGTEIDAKVHIIATGAIPVAELPLPPSVSDADVREMEDVVHNLRHLLSQGERTELYVIKASLQTFRQDYDLALMVDSRSSEPQGLDGLEELSGLARERQLGYWAQGAAVLHEFAKVELARRDKVSVESEISKLRRLHPSSRKTSSLEHWFPMFDAIFFECPRCGFRSLDLAREVPFYGGGWMLPEAYWRVELNPDLAPAGEGWQLVRETERRAGRDPLHLADAQTDDTARARWISKMKKVGEEIEVHRIEEREHEVR